MKIVLLELVRNLLVWLGEKLLSGADKVEGKIRDA